MNYLLMLFADEAAGLALPPDQMGRVMEDMGAYQAALEKAGAFVMTSPLARTSDARTLRYAGGSTTIDTSGEGLLFRNEGGELRVENGPFAETREQLGGFYIISAASMEDAIAWAKRCPALQWGSIEIRAMSPGY